MLQDIVGFIIACLRQGACEVGRAAVRAPYLARKYLGAWRSSQRRATRFVDVATATLRVTGDSR
jgi:hypothetical protein